MPGKRNIFLLLILLVFLAVDVFYFFSRKEPTKVMEIPQNVVFCTDDAKLCMDGSYVGRAGPKCDFYPCPNEKTFTNSDGVSFKYPTKLQTEYIKVQDWPPQVKILDAPFACTTAGNAIDRAGKTDSRQINGNNYCVTEVVEGAAGSIYTQYAYIFQKDGKVVDFTFTLRAIQCANYEDPKKTECENERSTFNINTLVDQMAQTVVIK